MWNLGTLVLNWEILSAENEWSLCGTRMLNWGGLCGTEGYSSLWLILGGYQFQSKSHSFWAPQNPSVPQPKPLSSTPKLLRFHLRSSTPETPQVHTKNPSITQIPQFHTKNPIVQHAPQYHTKAPQFNALHRQKIALHKRFGTEECVELWGFWCWTEVFWVLNWCGPCVEPMYWTEEVCVELRGTRY